MLKILKIRYKLFKLLINLKFKNYYINKDKNFSNLILFNILT